MVVHRRWSARYDRASNRIRGSREDRSVRIRTLGGKLNLMSEVARESSLALYRSAQRELDENRASRSEPPTDLHHPYMDNPRLRRKSRGNHGRQRRCRPAEELAQLMTVIEERAFRRGHVRIRQQLSHSFR